MKKFYSFIFICILALSCYASARTQYDSTGKILYDDTIRGQQRAQMQKAQEQKKMQAAAAAKIDYEQALKSIESQIPKTNYYQDSNEYKQKHNVR